MSKPGRPKSEHPLRYQVRHSPEQMAAWQAAAQADGRELQNWIRRTLDAASKPKRR
jgi:predicted HicB family RNase H-like nuclease